MRILSKKKIEPAENEEAEKVVVQAFADGSGDTELSTATYWEDNFRSKRRFECLLGCAGFRSFFFPLSCFQKLPCVCVYVCVYANFLRTSFLFQPVHPLSDYLVFPFSAPLLHCILSKWTCCAVQEQRNISCSLISPFFVYLTHSRWPVVLFCF